MSWKSKMLGIAVLGATVTATPLLAQTTPSQPDPLVAALRSAVGPVGGMLTKAAEQMSEADYAFQPTPEVRSFGKILAHVADSNYGMCATAKGEMPPVQGIEKTKTSKADIQKALGESFAYCESVWDTMTDARANTMVDFMGGQAPARALLVFATYHDLSHYGNVVTYMRLKGELPPSSQPGAPGAPPQDPEASE